MPSVQNNLGCQILRGTAQRVRFGGNLLGKTKVGQLQMTLMVKQNILRLQITIDYEASVQILERTHNLARVKHSRLRFELALSAQHTEKLTARYVLEKNEQKLVRMMRPIELDYKRTTIQVFQYVLFILHMLDLLQLYNVADAHYFECIVLFGQLMTSYHDSAKSASANGIQQVQLLQSLVLFFFGFQVILAHAPLGCRMEFGFVSAVASVSVGLNDLVEGNRCGRNLLD